MAAHHLDCYLAGLDRLTYPRAALSLGVLESDSRDGTFELLSARLARFCRVTLLRHDFGFHMPPVCRAELLRTRAAERARAHSRNRLLIGARADEDSVLWLDVDPLRRGDALRSPSTYSWEAAGRQLLELL